MNRTFRTVLAAAAVLGALVACTSKDVGGSPTPAPGTGGTTSTTTGSTSSSSSSSATDLDISKFVGAPCTALTEAQVAALTAVREAKSDLNGATGPGCTYQGKDVLANSTFRVIFVTKGKSFDDAVAEGKTKFPIFRTTQVAGYPAATYDGTDGKRACDTTIRASDKESVLVQVNIGKNDTKLNDGNACGTSERVAATVVENIKG